MARPVGRTRSSVSSALAGAETSMPLRSLVPRRPRDLRFDPGTAQSPSLPGWMMASGLVLAAVAELSWASLVLPAASPLAPLARFPTLAWLVAAGALLPRRRKGSRATSPADRAPAAADSARTSSELTRRPA